MSPLAATALDLPFGGTGRCGQPGWLWGRGAVGQGARSASAWAGMVTAARIAA